MLGGLLGWMRTTVGGLLLLVGLDISLPPYPTLSDLPLLWVLAQNGFVLNEQTYLSYILLSIILGAVILIVAMFVLGLTLRKMIALIKDNWDKHQKVFVIFLLFLAILVGGKLFGVFSVAGTEGSAETTITMADLIVSTFISAVGSIIASLTIIGVGMGRYLK